MTISNKQKLEGIEQMFQDFHEVADNIWTMNLTWTNRSGFRSYSRERIVEVIRKELDKFIYELSVFWFKRVNVRRHNMRVLTSPIKIEYSENTGYHVHFMIDVPEWIPKIKNPHIWTFNNWFFKNGKCKVSLINMPFWHFYIMKYKTAINHKEYTDNFIF